MEEPMIENYPVIHQNNDVILNNEIYLYSDISTEVAISFNKSIKIAEKNCLNIQNEFGLHTPPSIKIYINSEGGELFSAISMYNKMKELSVPTETYIDGIAASAATLISIAGDVRYMRNTSVMMIHQMRSFHGGTLENMKDESKNLDMMDKMIHKIYLEHSDFKPQDLDELLRRDLYMNPEECLKLKLIDSII